jgi:methylglutaconyl-CoA hydratase
MNPRFSTLELRRPSPQVAEVWLNRPEVHNAFNDTVIAGLCNPFSVNFRGGGHDDRVTG